MEICKGEYNTFLHRLIKFHDLSNASHKHDLLSAIFELVVCIWRHQKHDYSNFDMAFETIKRVCVPNLKSFGPTKTELRTIKGGELSIMLYGKMGWGRSHGCRNIDVWRFSQL